MSRKETTSTGDRNVQRARDVNNAILGLLERSRRVRITGLEGQNGLAVGLSGEVEVNASGNVGSYLGAFNNGAVIILRGNCGDLAGDSMASGGLIIEGDSGRDCGIKISGGVLVIKGSSGHSPGRGMTGGTVIISGDVNGDACPMMEGGLMIIAGNVKGRIGPLKNGGNVLIAGSSGGPEDWSLEVPLSENDLVLLEKYLKHYMIDAVPRTFRKLVPKNGKSIDRPGTSPIGPLDENVLDRSDVHDDRFIRNFLDDISFVTSDLNVPETKDPSRNGLVIGREESPGAVLFDDPFMMDLNAHYGLSNEVMLGVATACTMKGWPFFLKGKIGPEMRELFTSQRTRTIYRLDGRRNDLDLMMLKGSTVLELPILDDMGDRLPELTKGKDLNDLMDMLREVRAGPIMTSIRCTSVDNDMETVLLTEPDAVLLRSPNILSEPYDKMNCRIMNPIVHSLISTNKHFEVMGSRKKGVKLLVSGDIGGALDAVKLLCLGADGLCIGDHILRQISKPTAEGENLDGMDWSMIGERTMEAIGTFRRDIGRVLTELNISSYSQLIPQRLVALTYDTASVTGLPLAGYGSVLPMWMQ
ncbi:MAG: hypothetical protein MUC62_07285 [Candidatus Thermoplasmatota archaeon]|jgi:formylmethanofuran dehydrogenase subunit C|nr:hypothetical protein [Candidatus Thermoplasmatota archaeon]